MDKSLLKSIIKSKLKLCDLMIDSLPCNLKEPAGQLKAALIEAVVEASEGERKKEQPGKESEIGLKPVNIE